MLSHRGWLNTFRWAAFKLSILIPLAFFGLVKVPSSQEVALQAFVWNSHDRVRQVNRLNPYLHGVYDAWRSWNLEVERERVAEANKLSAESKEAAAA